VVTAGAPGGTVGLFAGVSLALLWVSLVAARTGADPGRLQPQEAMTTL
jgi:hypothetical protein